MTHQHQPLLIGFLCALAATVIWSGNFVVARGLMDQVPPITLAFLRWLVATAVFLPFAVKPIQREWPLVWQHKGFILALAMPGVALFNTLIYVASHTTTAMNLSLITITFPVFVIVLARIFLKEAIGFNKLAGIVLVIIGVVVLVSGGDWQRLASLTLSAGDGWMLLAAICFAGYSLMMKFAPKGISGWSLQFASFVPGLLMLLPFCLYELYQQSFSVMSINTGAWGAIFYVGVMASFLAYLVWGRAIAILGPVRSSLVYYTLPVFSGLLAWLLLGENITIVHLLSMGLILSGVVIALVNFNRLRPGKNT